MGILAVGTLDSLLRLIGTLIIFIFVLGITYLVTRWMGGFQKARGSNRNLRIVETIGVGNNKMISIVEAGTKYLVVSIGKDEVHLLAELTKEELRDLSVLEENTGAVSTESFGEILDKLKEKWPKKQD
ncbi:MAG: flagellar biosynthetic protein FliO [Muribaculaceae bacterium]|nr:flagellar biosynthetic protein FliO [Roseburia sp.]MCM1431064.1 flagellar biosynthetic protein FliO [Muribaculaceae bacterium]MCM1493324.1 flagellar biosynthetic protein FliO [Muribaculaceae bacterium]